MPVSSTFSTSAPRSASSNEQKPPGSRRERSRTRMPASGRLTVDPRDLEDEVFWVASAQRSGRPRRRLCRRPAGTREPSGSTSRGFGGGSSIDGTGGQDPLARLSGHGGDAVEVGVVVQNCERARLGGGGDEQVGGLGPTLVLW